MGRSQAEGFSVQESCELPSSGRYLSAVTAPVGPRPANASETPPFLSTLTRAPSAISDSGRIRLVAQKRCSRSHFDDQSRIARGLSSASRSRRWYVIRSEVGREVALRHEVGRVDLDVVLRCLWVDRHAVGGVVAVAALLLSPARSSTSSGRVRIAACKRASSPGQAPMRCAPRSRRHAGRPASLCSVRTTSATGESASCTCAAFPGPGSASSSANGTCR